jgi:hypothetical protein
MTRRTFEDWKHPCQEKINKTLTLIFRLYVSVVAPNLASIKV